MQTTFGVLLRHSETPFTFYSKLSSHFALSLEAIHRRCADSIDSNNLPSVDGLIELVDSAVELCFWRKGGQFTSLVFPSMRDAT